MKVGCVATNNSRYKPRLNERRTTQLIKGIDTGFCTLSLTTSSRISVDVVIVHPWAIVLTII
ncbi:MAG: hypothetical protein HC941_25355 [Microcoleus sp. SU_5_3]|nr:hypothetical protein [Microcoleus sp. SU_5_3]